MTAHGASAAFTPGRLGPVTLRNRVVKTATFEGMTPRGVPTDALVAHHRTLAAGGVGMTTVAHCDACVAEMDRSGVRCVLA